MLTFTGLWTSLIETLLYRINRILGNLRRVTGLYSRVSTNQFLISVQVAMNRSPGNAMEAAEHLEAETEKPIGALQRVFSKFHLIVQKLRKRHGHRGTLEVKDEYDVHVYRKVRLLLFRPRRGGMFIFIDSSGQMCYYFVKVNCGGAGGKVCCRGQSYKDVLRRLASQT